MKVLDHVMPREKRCSGHEGIRPCDAKRKKMQSSVQ